MIMRLLLAVAPVLAFVQSVIAASSNTPYKPVPYTQAPSYYPGAPWNLPGADTRPTICEVVAAGKDVDDAPTIIEAFQKCKRNAKVVFADTTCR